MALTSDEKAVFIKKLATISFSQYESFSQVTKDEIDLLLFGAEETQRSALQEFIEDVLLPQKTESKSAYDSAAASVQSEINTLTALLPAE